ncbi:MAG: hypothetical protein QOE90_385 [Thermoplasmata archaeon]|jgi:hypothetical protein|nr:hypothetical protein [Thermoplasmata archaeon]
MSATRFASRAALSAAALFALMFASFGLPNAPAFNEAKVALGVLAHAALLPVVAALAAPGWARVGGYAWAAGDIILNVATLNAGAAPGDATFTLIMSLRYGLHVCAAVWLLASAWENRGAFGAATAVMGLALGGFSFIAPFVPAWALYPVMVLLVVWLVLASRTLGKGAREDAGAAARLSPS